MHVFRYRSYRWKLPNIIVRTPGQVFDMLNLRYLSSNCIKMFVRYKADETLSHGFKDRIYDKFQKLNSTW